MSRFLSPSEAAEARTRIIETVIVPRVRGVFARFPALQSAMLLVAQYWCDEAVDAVHCSVLFSVLQTPKLKAAIYTDEFGNKFSVNLPKPLPSNRDLWWNSHEFLDSAALPWWDDNGEAIPAFAAFCKEGAHEEMSFHEAYTPYAVLRRDGENLSIEVVGTMLRPWLDGVASEEG